MVTTSVLNQPDHDLLIELKTMMGILMGKYEDAAKNYLLLDSRVQKLENSQLTDNFPNRVVALEKIVNDLPVKPEELPVLVSWVQNLMERWKGIAATLLIVGAILGFALSRISDILKIVGK